MVALALAQDVLFARVSVLGGRPDVVFLAVVGWGLLRGSGEGMVWAFIGGVVLDVMSGGPMGALTLCLLAAAFLAGRQWGRELGSPTLQVLLLNLILCFAFHALLLLILLWRGHTISWGYSLAQIAAPSAVVNAVLAPFVYYVLTWLDRRTRPEGLTFDV